MITVIEWEASPVSVARRAELHAMPPVSVTVVSPVTAIAASFFIRSRCVGVADQRELIRMLGLDVPAEKPPREPHPQVQPHPYRKSTKRKRLCPTPVSVSRGTRPRESPWDP